MKNTVAKALAVGGVALSLFASSASAWCGSVPGRTFPRPPLPDWRIRLQHDPEVYRWRGIPEVHTVPHPGGIGNAVLDNARLRIDYSRLHTR
jgi:hypothetical protein